MSGQPVKYTPTPQQRRGSEAPYLYLVPSQSSQGVGAEATEVALLMHSLVTSMSMTETLARAPLAELDQDIAAIPYTHVEVKQVGSVKVRYCGAGVLPPRAIPIDDE